MLCAAGAPSDHAGSMHHGITALPARRREALRAVASGSAYDGPLEYPPSGVQGHALVGCAEHDRLRTGGRWPERALSRQTLRAIRIFSRIRTVQRNGRRFLQKSPWPRGADILDGALNGESRRSYLILPSLYSTCLRTTGSYFLTTIFSVMVRAFFLVT